jgi:hypothetical protein
MALVRADQVGSGLRKAVYRTLYHLPAFTNQNRDSAELAWHNASLGADGSKPLRLLTSLRQLPASDLSIDFAFRLVALITVALLDLARVYGNTLRPVAVHRRMLSSSSARASS